MLKAPVDLDPIPPMCPEGSSRNYILLFIFLNLPLCNAISQDIAQTTHSQVIVSPLLFVILCTVLFLFLLSSLTMNLLTLCNSSSNS